MYFQSVQSFTPAGDLRKKTLLGCYGSNFKYTEFHVMSSITSAVVFTVVLFFGAAMLLIDPVSHIDTEIFTFSFFLLTFIRFVMLLKSYFRNQGKVPQKSRVNVDNTLCSFGLTGIQDYAKWVFQSHEYHHIHIITSRSSKDSH